MKDLILIIEDNVQIAYIISNILELNNYESIHVTNGLEALEQLHKLEIKPQLILCDIMMPELDGYQLFNELSMSEEFFDIPFVFLTAKSSPKDIRRGKKLGVDDYLTKPFSEEELLASIEGKIQRSKNVSKLRHQIMDKIPRDLLENISLSKPVNKGSVYLLLIEWNDILGPEIKLMYPETFKQEINTDQLTVQLFQTIISVYGEMRITKPQGIPLFLENINMSGYIYINARVKEESLVEKVPFMLVILSPKINYLVSEKFRTVLEPISSKIMNKKTWDIKETWEQIVDVLSD